MGVGEELTPSHWTQWTEWWSSLLLTSLPQPGQHPPQSGDGPGPRETNPQRDCQQQRTPANAEHQRRFPVPQNTPAPHGRRETQQGAKKTCKHGHIEEDLFEFHVCFSNSYVQTSSYLSVHYSHFFPFSVRRPSCSRQRTTSSPWSRKRHSSWHRTTSWNASSR